MVREGQCKREIDLLTSSIIRNTHDQSLPIPALEARVRSLCWVESERTTSLTLNDRKNRKSE